MSHSFRLLEDGRHEYIVVDDTHKILGAGDMVDVLKALDEFVGSDGLPNIGAAYDRLRAAYAEMMK